MSLPTATKANVSVEEYYQLELTAEERSDYYDGEMFCMAGGTTEHSAINANLIGVLHAALKGKTCRPFTQDQRIKSDETGLRIYPDASVFCEPLTYDSEDGQKHTATNPTALFEVLSESTEAYDRGFKFECFRQCASLRLYVLIAQDRPHVDVFVRDGENEWRLFDVSGMDQPITLPVIDVTLTTTDLYDRVEFPEGEYLT